MRREQWFSPHFDPGSLALSRPSVVLALISSLSNSARPPNTVSISLPAGVVVSAQGSARDLNRQPRSAICFTMVNRSIVDLPSRSNRVTTITDPGSSALRSRCSSGLSHLAPSELRHILRCGRHSAFCGGCMPQICLLSKTHSKINGLADKRVAVVNETALPFFGVKTPYKSVNGKIIA